MFIGAAGGIGLSHLPGLPLVPGVAIGIGAMAVGMLKLPLTSVLLTVLILGNDGITTMPLVIVAVVVSFVATTRLEPAPAAASPANADTPGGRDGRSSIDHPRAGPKLLCCPGAT